MTKRSRLAAIAVVGATLGLVAAACGDDSGSSATTAAGTTAKAADTTAKAADTTAAATTAKSADTTAAGATTTAAGGTATTAGTTPMKFAFTIDGAKCPDAAKAKLPDGAPLKVAFIGPQTGPAAGFGIIGKGMQAMFDKINTEQGGVNGHKLELVVKDDGYDPGKTKPAAQEAVEKDGIIASVLQVGSPNVAAVRDYYEQNCTPQAFVGTGLPRWGDPEHYKFTNGGILAYNTEANIWAEAIAKQKPGAKVAFVGLNNDFGKGYQKAFEDAAKANGLEIVSNINYEATSTLVNEATQTVASNPDYVVSAALAGQCGTLAKNLRQGGYTGPLFVSATCFATQFIGTPEVGKASENTFGVAYLKDPNDPQWADDAAVKQYKDDIAKYGNGADPKISSVGTGYVFADLIANVLKDAASSQYGLSRLGVAESMWNVNEVLPLAYPGAKFIIDGTKDAYGVEYGEVREFVPTGTGGGTYKSTGQTFDVEGKTGLFKG